MTRILLILLTTLTLLTASAAKPRTQRNIRQQRQQTTEQIKETNRRIRQNSKETERQLNQLNLLSGRIRETNLNIAALQKSLDSINGAVTQLSDSIKNLEDKLDLMRKKYGAAVKKIHSSRHSINNLAFMFASESVSQAYRRMRYLEEYSRWRQRRTDEISDAVKQLDAQRVELDARRKQQADAVARLAEAKAELSKQKDSTNTLVKSLKKEGSSLKALLKEKEKEARKLDAELEKIIAEEQRKAAEEEARKKREAEKKRQSGNATDSSGNKSDTKTGTAKPSADKKSQSTPAKDAPDDKAYKALTGSFEQNKGKLPYPVGGRYTVVRPFGRTTHPELPHVQVDNSGIDIEVQPGTTVRAVFDGKVSEIFQLSGFENIVMVRHGRYLTIYANVDAITVKKGDTVKAGMTIGKVHADPADNNRSILHFEIREERKKLDPQLWLR